MKIRAWTGGALLLAAMLTAGCGDAGQTAATSQPQIQKAEEKTGNPHYWDMQEKLDEGGSMYVYMDCRNLLKGMVAQIGDQIRPAITDPADAAEFEKIFGKIDQGANMLGLYGLEDIGLSTIREENHYYLHRFCLATPGDRTGLLALLGDKPHAFETLEFAPEDTVYFQTLDLDAAQLWSLIQKMTAELGGEEAAGELAKASQELKDEIGLNYDEIATTLGDSATLLVSIDPEKTITIPDAAFSNPIPMFNGAAIVKTNNSALYDTLVQALRDEDAPLTESETPEGLKKAAIKPGDEIPYTPVVAQDGDYLYLASDEAYLDVLLATKAQGGALAETDEFKAMAAGLPTEGNLLYYVSEKLAPTIQHIIKLPPTDVGEEERVAIGFMRNAIRQTLRAEFSILRAESDGIAGASRSQSSSNPLLFKAAMFPTMGILATIAVPNFLEAKTRAKVSRVKSNMRSMATALEAYCIDNNAYPAHSEDVTLNAYQGLEDINPALTGQPTFMLQNGSNMMTLTTPIAFVTSYFSDPFSAPLSATFSYFSSQEQAGWILWSPGPDKIYDLTTENISELYLPANGQYDQSRGLIELTFDPTNGTISPGDVWRVKQ